ncbi:MAG TPA: J domain-containing protein [Candidatus Limnocylindria bacterium]|nr:J domain-containing protein [Candidatus Limnocylindria bacterium]
MLLSMYSKSPDLYRVLQVDPGANSLVIQAAYRVLARIFHPDASGDDDSMKRINAAWEVLGDSRLRARYDLERAGRHPGPAVAASPARAAVPGWRPSAAAQGVPRTPAASSATGDDSAGQPQGTPFGPVLHFGRYDGWSIGQVARVDRPFLEWLSNAPAGRTMRDEIETVLSTRKGPEAVDERRHYETIRGRASA